MDLCLYSLDISKMLTDSACSGYLVGIRRKANTGKTVYTYRLHLKSNILSVSLIIREQKYFWNDEFRNSWNNHADVGCPMISDANDICETIYCLYSIKYVH